MHQSASFRGLKGFRILYSDSTDKSPGASLILSYTSRICLSETLFYLNNDSAAQFCHSDRRLFSARKSFSVFGRENFFCSLILSPRESIDQIHTGFLHALRLNQPYCFRILLKQFETDQNRKPGFSELPVKSISGFQDRQNPESVGFLWIRRI